MNQAQNLQFTFCIATCDVTLSNFDSLETVTMCATNEEQARSKLSGLPLVFIKRTRVEAAL